MKERVNTFSIFVLMTLLCNVPANGGENKNPFAGESLPEGWTWKRANPQAWRIRNQGLEIQIEPGNMWGGQNDAKNVLLIPIAEDSQESGTDVWVTLANSPTRRWEQVDLVWYYRDSHMVKIGLELENGKNSVVMGREEDDRTRTIKIIPIEKDEVTVRLRVTGGQVRGYYRLAPEDEWTDVGICTEPRPAGSNDRAQVSIQCYQGDPQNPHWARITGLNISSATETKAESDARMQWWRESRFGMFIHWGPVSLTGLEISWSRANSNPKCPNKGPTPIDVYDRLYQRFNPIHFDAREWVDTAHAAGMKYMVLTAKHCDGFLLWHSQADGYNIANTPFQRDICQELAKAAHDEGMRLGWYFSPMDWRDPDFRTERHAEFVGRIQKEIRELLGNYGRIDLLWFDWDGREPLYDQPNTYAIVRSMQPGIIVNNRLDLGIGNNDNEILSANADYYTPEQRIGQYDDQRPWETCMTLGTQWSWKPNDTIKSAKEIIHILARTAGGDGNLLLNVGPMPDGRMEPRQVEVLQQVGAWLETNGEGIYGTRGGPFKPTSAWVSTHKANTVYVHLLKWGDETITLPPLHKKIIKSQLLTGGTVSVAQTDSDITLTVPQPDPQNIDTIVKLTLDGPADEIPPLDATNVGAVQPNR